MRILIRYYELKDAENNVYQHHPVVLNHLFLKRLLLLCEETATSRSDLVSV
jgi:hypothetical protein